MQITIACIFGAVLSAAIIRQVFANHPVLGDYVLLMQMVSNAIFILPALVVYGCYLFILDGRERDLLKVLNHYPNRFDIG